MPLHGTCADEFKKEQDLWTLENHEKRAEEYEDLHNVAVLRLKRVSLV